jgi:hypothetical protein
MQNRIAITCVETPDLAVAKIFRKVARESREWARKIVGGTGVPPVFE